jgi:RNA polymerase sigma-70 factor (ECF subfamily)
MAADQMEAPMNPSQAAQALFQEHGPAIYRFAVVLLHHHQDAEDVVQETFLKLLRHLGAGGNTDNLRGWLFTVAAHASRDRQRRRARWIPWASDRDAPVDPPPLPDEDGRLRVVRAALRQLSDRDRLLLVLRAQDLSYRDIAVAAGIRPSSVGRLLARAVDRWTRECSQSPLLRSSTGAADGLTDVERCVKPERHGLR